MFKKLLVAINQGVSDRPVFEEALAIAKANQGSLLLLHVLPIETQTRMFPAAMLGYGAPILVEATMEHFQQEWQKLEQEGLDLLQELTTVAKLAHVPCEFTQLIGNPSTLICDIAADSQSDLIVLGRRGYSGFGELMAGSVSNYVLHHAACSVLVVQNVAVEGEEAIATKDNATVS